MRTAAGRAGQWAGRIALLGALVAAAAGCGGGAVGTSPPPSPPPSPSSSPSPSPSVTAKDGTDTGACTDGSCEIAVSEPVAFDLELPDGSAKLAVTKVGENEVAYKVTKDNGETKGGASGKGSGCTAFFTDGGSNSSCGPAGGPPSATADTVVLQLVSGADGTALLRLVSD
ncbi:hypothetical protein CLV63_12629 [Murinocardiopsis flavida]|uniref:Uncharacterized protein n=1 Tax=Murinocardiopsis flavida TaxID=645275 RepID=A0A2P8CWN4_9ACTN|nr:hypothetical protein [Murinocardiopsis flavida]PSK89393.1 hypothetical protein CLV63_12629 [Murinocardiopsis flavida]